MQKYGFHMFLNAQRQVRNWGSLGDREKAQSLPSGFYSSIHQTQSLCAVGSTPTLKWQEVLSYRTISRRCPYISWKHYRTISHLRKRVSRFFVSKSDLNFISFFITNFQIRHKTYLKAYLSPSSNGPERKYFQMTCMCGSLRFFLPQKWCCFRCLHLTPCYVPRLRHFNLE